MSRRRLVYEGKAKILYEGPEPGTLIQYFKDDATAFNAQKKGTISGKGVLNNRISEHIFTLLGAIVVIVLFGPGDLPLWAILRWPVLLAFAVLFAAWGLVLERLHRSLDDSPERRHDRVSCRA